MVTDSSINTSQSLKATHADYAAADFKPCITEKEAEKFGGEILSNQCVNFRIAVVMLSKSKESFWLKLKAHQKSELKSLLKHL
ncbi:MAG: hypothetical protein LRY36_01225 [Alphaproteobacteria bacterium]|nr:hypothetical protein [Alphaproteobacteria bacterium]MCD8566540.1 hypothetical protein [Alphaproteobacteria bacterium]